MDEIARSALGDIIISVILGVGLDGMKVADEGIFGWMNGKTADPGTGKAGGEYRAVKPENIEMPTVPIINVSMQTVADMNGGTMPEKGNYIRKTAFQRTAERLGLNENEAAYIEAENITRNGDAYVLKITKSSLNKMLSASSYPNDIVPLESIAILDQIERIVQSGVWYDGKGDRDNRDQIAGYDYLKATAYIDGVPYAVNIRVRIERKTEGNENRVYFFTPETVEVTMK